MLLSPPAHNGELPPDLGPTAPTLLCCSGFRALYVSHHDVGLLHGAHFRDVWFLCMLGPMQSNHRSHGSISMGQHAVAQHWQSLRKSAFSLSLPCVCAGLGACVSPRRRQQRPSNAPASPALLILLLVKQKSMRIRVPYSCVHRPGRVRVAAAAAPAPQQCSRQPGAAAADGAAGRRLGPRGVARPATARPPTRGAAGPPLH